MVRSTLCSVVKTCPATRGSVVKRPSWYNRDWAPPAKQHTKNSYSGRSKRATRGHSDSDDRSRQWEDSKPGGSTRDNEEVIEVATVAEVEVENCDRYHGRVAADSASTAPARTTWDSETSMATEKEAVRSRLELHHLLSNLKGSLSATCKKNAEANDRANDMNQKTIQGPGYCGGGVRNLRGHHEKGDV